MQKLTIAFTGHRPDKLNNEYNGIGVLSNAIRKDIQHMVDQHKVQLPQTFLSFIVGMALGVDQLAAEVAIVNDIPFIAAIPCLNQDAKWPIHSRDRYQRILASRLCTIHHTSTQPYDNSCMQTRNIWMVDNSDKLRAYYDGTKGGTFNCINYARTKSKLIDIIDPSSLIRTNKP